MKEREKLGSRLGFILISAGCAIGIGNVWKFPYMAGQGGGGTFVLFYLIFLALLGLPVMTMEFSVGRASQKSPVKAYYALEKPGQKWHTYRPFRLRLPLQNPKMTLPRSETSWKPMAISAGK